MVTGTVNSNKTVNFRSDSGNESFDIVLDVKVDGNRATPSTNSLKFFEYLKTLGIVKKSVSSEDWFNSFDSLTLTFFSASHDSYRIRRKAELLQLTVILGDSFKKNRDFKKSKPAVC